MVSAADVGQGGTAGAAAVLLASAALLSWPAPVARVRLRAIRPLAAVRRPGTGNPARRWALGALVGRHPGVFAVLGAAGLGTAGAGLGGALAASVAMGTFARRWSRRRRARRHSAELSALLDAVRVMAGELRAGAHPAAAAASAATGDSRAHRMLGSVAAAAALGAEIPAMLERRSAAEPVLASEIRRVASAWSLADRHGAALAELMDAVRVDLEARVRQAGQVNAQLAGPRATAAVLAGLPLLGVLMGQGIGADPWHVLSATALGQMLLVLGVGLSCAGTLWSGWITSRGTAG